MPDAERRKRAFPRGAWEREAGKVKGNDMKPPPFQLGTAAGFVVLLTLSSARADETFFRLQVAPIFERHCLKCHGQKSQRGGLSLAAVADMQAGSDSGPVVIAGKPRESLLLSMVSGDKPKMPKKAAPLTAKQIAVLTKWIAEGANWPKDVALRDRSDSGEKWWSLQPLTRPAIPGVQTSRWVRNPIDAFIL